MHATRGIVYLIGSGPGAPDLITLRGAERLARAEVVLYDELSVHGGALDHVPAGAELIYVGKRGSQHVMPQEEITALLVRHAQSGRRVARLKGGDPFIFGRGGEEAEALFDAGIPFEVVPGLSSALAAPALAGVPLTHRNHADGFRVFTGHRRGADAPPLQETAVVLTATQNLADNVLRLQALGYDPRTPALLVQWGTLPRQRTVEAPLDRIAQAAANAELGSPAVLVVGDVVRARRKLAWFEGLPLFGLRVLVTRARHQAQETCRLLEQLGAEAIAMPTIAMGPPPDPAPLEAAVRQIESFQMLIFTSVNTVEPFMSALFAAGQDARALGGQTICAVGPATVQALRAQGLRADLVPDEHRAEGPLDLLTESRVGGQRIPLPRAVAAREILPETLSARGAEVEVAAVYENTLPKPEAYAAALARLTAGEVDVLTFTSASTAHNFAAICGDQLSALTGGKLVVAIGPSTREALTALGLSVDLMLEKYTLPAMTDALLRHITARRPTDQ